jgi:hypothetical protein
MKTERDKYADKFAALAYDTLAGASARDVSGVPNESLTRVVAAAALLLEARLYELLLALKEKK